MAVWLQAVIARANRRAGRMKRANIFIAIAASMATAAAMIATPALGQLVGEAPAPPQTPVQLAQAAPAPAARAVPVSQAAIQQPFAPVVRATSPAVVNVFTSKTAAICPYNDPTFAQFFCGRDAGRTQRQQASLGSGVIVGADGVIVTNEHVVEAGDEFKVVLQDRREFDAQLVLADPRTDLAVLKIDVGGERLPTLSFADTSQVQVGDLVLAIGNPFGVGQTVTSGIVSALARTDVGVSDYSSFIQTDASINPGNSGGALVDMQGRLVGVNSMIFSRTGGSVGIGFAIPSEMVRRVVDAAINGGTLVRPWLGAKGEAVTMNLARAAGLDRPRGVILSEIYRGGPADRAGLKEGDIVLSIDGRDVFDDRGMKFIAATKAEGDTLSIAYLRDRQERTANLRLARLPGTTEADLKQIGGRNPFSGAVIAELSPALAEELSLDPVRYGSGLLVFQVPYRSIAGSLGLRPRDVIREVNGVAVRSRADLDRAVERAGGQGVWRLAIERNGERIETSVRV
jgi:Do/DeqQ family serine protease